MKMGVQKQKSPSSLAWFRKYTHFANSGVSRKKALTSYRWTCANNKCSASLQTENITLLTCSDDVIVNISKVKFL